MILRRVLEELEAKLRPLEHHPNQNSRGKLEFKRYANARQRMKIKCKGLGLSDGTPLELRCGDIVVAHLVVKDARAEIDEERPIHENSPPISAGEEITLFHGDQPLLRGRLYID